MYKKKLKRFLLFIILPLVLAWTVGLYAIKHCGYVINYTGSMPYGLYKETPLKLHSVKIGMDVLICVPDKAVKDGISKGYIKSSDACANGGEAIIKKVIAISGDQVSIGDNKITVKHQGETKSYPAPIQKVSLSGQPVTGWATQKTYMLKDQVWAYGAYEYQYSWDSRYFGAVPESHILYQLTPIWVSHKTQHNIDNKGFIKWVK